MSDKMTPEQRHNCMASIHSKNTRPEMIVRKFLFHQGFRYRIHVKQLPGSPDIVIVGLRTAIFVNGCFWHGHEGCGLYVMPKSNVSFWQKKIERNRERDAANRIHLKEQGWHVVEIWECQLRPKQAEQTMKGLLRTLNLIVLDNHHASISYDLGSHEDEGLMVAEDDDIYNTTSKDHQELT